jgi:S-adenosylmethionine:tRNA ribosyltransferase-isomerase
MKFFDYELPAQLIAQEPAAERDDARLLFLPPAPACIQHQRFRDLPELLRPGDLLILNDTKVLPARLFGRREKTLGKVEGLFLGQTTDGCWELLVQTRCALRDGEIIQIEPGPLRLELRGRSPEGHWLARPDQSGTPVALLARHGHMPLPPYIRKGVAGAEDSRRYQTVFAARPGAVAAPTAGLHFTPAVFEGLNRRGIDLAYLTLHVGIGTFQPIREPDYRTHVMHGELGELPEGTAEAISACRARGGRVVAVGTTSVRALETVAASGPIRAWSGQTHLFIYPPYEFRAVDALITNFHLPRSTLLLLVGAFAGPERLRLAYETAIVERYRFYSYGDAMLIEK